MNKYEVLGVVGEGAYGVVLKCRNKESGGVVAIKKFKESDDDEILRKTTLREVKILRLLRHSNIVSLIEAFRRKGKLYLVFEYVEKNLLEVLEEQPQGLEPDLVRVYIYQLCQAIHWCHNHDVIHRDIKPENLLINVRSRSLKLCDFGFARVVTSTAEELTDYVATRWYRAPELLLGSTNYTSSVDIWAIGCIMGEITDGQPIFPGESEVDQLYIIQKVLGPLTPEHTEMFLQNPRFSGLKFPDMTRPETLQKKYVGKLSKRAISFLRAVLSLHPLARPTSTESLAHAYFEELNRGANGSLPEAQSPRTNWAGVVAAAGPAVVNKQSSKVVEKEREEPKSIYRNNVNSINSDYLPPDEAKEGSRGMPDSGLYKTGVSGRIGGGGGGGGGKDMMTPSLDWRPSLPEDTQVSGGFALNNYSNFGRPMQQSHMDSNGYNTAAVNTGQGGALPLQPLSTPLELMNLKSNGEEYELDDQGPMSSRNRENRERAREIEKEVERERERQREREIRAFREFSTKLPLRRRVHSVTSSGGGKAIEAADSGTNLSNPNLLLPLRTELTSAAAADQLVFQPYPMHHFAGQLPVDREIAGGVGSGGPSVALAGVAPNPPLNPRVPNKTPRAQQQVPPLESQLSGQPPISFISGRSERSRGGSRPLAVLGGGGGGGGMNSYALEPTGLGVGGGNVVGPPRQGSSEGPSQHLMLAGNLREGGLGSYGGGGSGAPPVYRLNSQNTAGGMGVGGGGGPLLTTMGSPATYLIDNAGSGGGTGGGGGNTSHLPQIPVSFGMSGAGGPALGFGFGMIGLSGGGTNNNSNSNSGNSSGLLGPTASTGITSMKADSKNKESGAGGGGRNRERNAHKDVYNSSNHSNSNSNGNSEVVDNTFYPGQPQQQRASGTKYQQKHTSNGYVKAGGGR